MADGTIGVDEPSTIDLNVDTENLGGTPPKHRERIQISGAVLAEIARVLNAAPAGTEYGLVTRNIPSGTQTTDPSDRALRDMGKIDIAAFDVALPAGTNNIGDVDVLSLPALPAGTNNIGDVDVLSGPTGASALQGQGAAAHDAAVAGNPLRIGVQGRAGQQAAVTDTNTVNLQADRHGNLRMRAGVEAPAGAITTHVHFPAANTQATISKTAGAAGVRHVCTGITAVLAGGTTAPAAAQVNVALRDGATGAGAILWQAAVSLPATAGAMNGITRSGVWIPGTAATAMTLEFSAAGGANTFESVSMEIVDITE